MSRKIGRIIFDGELERDKMRPTRATDRSMIPLLAVAVGIGAIGLLLNAFGLLHR